MYVDRFTSSQLLAGDDPVQLAGFSSMVRRNVGRVMSRGRKAGRVVSATYKPVTDMSQRAASVPISGFNIGPAHAVGVPFAPEPPAWDPNAPKIRRNFEVGTSFAQRVSGQVRERVRMRPLHKAPSIASMRANLDGNYLLDNGQLYLHGEELGGWWTDLKNASSNYGRQFLSHANNMTRGAIKEAVPALISAYSGKPVQVSRAAINPQTGQPIVPPGSKTVKDANGDTFIVGEDPADHSKMLMYGGIGIAALAGVYLFARSRKGKAKA